MENFTQTLSALLHERDQKLSIAESCTGGLVAAAITSLPGSSHIFERGFITYSNQAKIDLLSVAPETLDKCGAVSAQTAAEMAAGALKNATATIAVSITGIAGPDGGAPEKPVGTVYIGIATPLETKTYHHTFNGTRAEIRAQSRDHALKHLVQTLS